MSSFGERFKRIRVSKGLTQEELADDFNKQYGYALTKATISWSYVNILDTKSQTFLCCTSS